MLPILSVFEFITQVNDIIAGEFIIEGEISQYKVSQNKWIFFVLKDNQACLNCFSTVFMIRTPLEDGMRVRVVGYPKIQEKSGRFSLVVQKVELAGDGSLQRAYALLKEKLSKEGLFSIERKRQLPVIPERIGIITSADGAALGDFRRIVFSRWPGVELVLRSTAVQGSEAVEDIVSALQEFNAHSASFDILVLIRGGGSLEDLAAFNSEEVARALFASRIPVLAGIGHERDETLADLVADVRASTPSNAAERAVPDKQSFIKQLDQDIYRIGQSLQHKTLLVKEKLHQQVYFLSSQLEMPLLKGKVVVAAFYDLLNNLQSDCRKKQAFLSASERLLLNINPRHLLRRGYSIVRKKTGKIVSSNQEVDIDERLMIELAQGSLTSIVEEIT